MSNNTDENMYFNDYYDEETGMRVCHMDKYRIDTNGGGGKSDDAIDVGACINACVRRMRDVYVAMREKYKALSK